MYWKILYYELLSVIVLIKWKRPILSVFLQYSFFFHFTFKEFEITTSRITSCWENISIKMQNVKKCTYDMLIKCSLLSNLCWNLLRQRFYEIEVFWLYKNFASERSYPANCNLPIFYCKMQKKTYQYSYYTIGQYIIY